MAFDRTSEQRDRYVADAVATASPARLVTMLYDRLVRDLLQAEQAMREGDDANAGRLLGHASEIVLELRAALDPSAWSGGPGLAALYSYLLTELLAAHVSRDASKVAACRDIVEPLAATWQEAATLTIGRAVA
jgi:flagellar protein FliS